jgi:hydroxymethylglutaryl-CoA synthase
MRLGIEKIRAWPSTGVLDMADLCAARNHDPKDVSDNLFVDARSVSPPWEDPVTYAINAAMGMLSDEDRERIELVIVGTETAVDLEKPISSWVHRHMGLKRHCRNFEVKHACYSGTAGLMMALGWLASGLSPDGKALVINTDHSTVGIGDPWEYVMGCAAAAMLVSRQPGFFEIEWGKSGLYSNEVSDVIRPTGRVETGNSETSLFSYLEGVDGAYDAYEARVGEVDFDAYFAKNIYHIPFGGITFRAHKMLLGRWKDVSKAEAWESYQKKTLPSLTFNRRISATYGSSTFIGLLGLVHACEDLMPGDRVGIYAYGSGSMAEFWSGLIGDNARRVERAADLKGLLDARKKLTVAQYEAVERERDASVGARDYVPSRDLVPGWWEECYAGKGLFYLEKVEGHFRHYGFS